MSFGRQMLEHWLLDPQITYLNHGTVGATPRRVLEAQQAIRNDIEQQPSRYLFRELYKYYTAPGFEKTRLRAVADIMAGFVGAKGDDLVFVNNATTGVNAILRSLDFQKDDEILITDHEYLAVANVATFIARERGARVNTVTLPYPVYDPSAIGDALANALTPKTRIIVIDHITSASAIILPLAEIAKHCRKKGIPVLADGAHAPGMLPLDIPSLDVDWYVGTFHKWAFAPRSCGFLWAAPEHQKSLHPTVISLNLGLGFTDEFDWVGTCDPSAYIAAPEGIAFLCEMGVEAVREYNHNLAWEAARMLTERFGTELYTDEQMVGAMATFPLPERWGKTQQDADALRDTLLFEDKIEAQIHAWGERLFLRISAQIYNDMSDIEHLATALETRT